MVMVRVGVLLGFRAEGVRVRVRGYVVRVGVMVRVGG